MQDELLEFEGKMLSLMREEALRHEIKLRQLMARLDDLDSKRSVHELEWSLESLLISKIPVYGWERDPVHSRVCQEAGAGSY